MTSSIVMAVVGAILAVTSPLLALEWSFARRWRRGVQGVSVVPWDVMRAVACCRARLGPGLLDQICFEYVPQATAPSLDVAGWTELVRAWWPWGSTIYRVRITPLDPGPALIHEVVAHCYPHALGRGWNEDHSDSELEIIEAEIRLLAQGGA